MPQSVIQPVCLSVLPPPLCPWGLPTCNGLFLESSSIFQLNPTSSFSCQLGLPSSGSFPWPPRPGQASLPLTPTASSRPLPQTVAWTKTVFGSASSEGLRLLSGQGPHLPLLYTKLHTQHRWQFAAHFLKIYFLIISLFFKLNISSQEWNVHQ